MSESITVFPDTNILLHYPPLAHIDWCAACKAKAVKLVICLQVVHELDQKKDDPCLSSRAQRAIKEIREYQVSGKEIRDGVTVTVFNQEIRRPDFPPSLSPDSGDDCVTSQ